MAAWAEHGTVPPASTAYDIVDGQVVVSNKASERNGVQPVVAVEVEHAEVDVDQEVKFSATIELPANTGSIVGVEWDFDGSGEFATKSKLEDTKSRRVEVEARHAFKQPGSYFPAVRASSHRDGRADTPFARIQNLGRVRVIVK